jgi:hypothetical protein
MNEVKRIIKYFLSFFRSTWKLNDYPIRVRHLEATQADADDRLVPVPWEAQIINWWAMFGSGQSVEEALADLRHKFEQFKGSGKKLPRPGTKVAIEFAPTTQIEQYEEMAVHFMEKILGINYYNCFISDESSLWDFPTKSSKEEYHQKIALIYGVDVSDIDSGNLVEIFKRIRKQQ